MKKRHDLAAPGAFIYFIRCLFTTYNGCIWDVDLALRDMSVPLFIYSFFLIP